MNAYMYKFGDFTLTGLYEYDPPESATYDHPGSEAVVTVVSAHLDGSSKDALELIDTDVIEQIENYIREGRASDREDALVAAAEARREAAQLYLLD